MLVGALALSLAIASSGEATAAPGACDLSEGEKATAKATAARLVRRPDAEGLIMAATSGATGCGVWEVTVAPDGRIRALRLLRGEHSPTYEKSLRRTLIKALYQPSAGEWTGVFRLDSTRPD